MVTNKKLMWNTIIILSIALLMFFATIKGSSATEIPGYVVKLRLENNYTNQGTGSNPFQAGGSGNSFDNAIYYEGAYSIDLTGAGYVKSGCGPSGFATGNVANTMFGRFYFDAQPSVGQQWVLLHNGNVDTNDQMIFFTYENNGGTYRLQVAGGVAGTIQYNIQFNTSQWYWIATKYNSGSRVIELWIDGVNVANGTRSVNLNLQYPCSGSGSQAGQFVAGGFPHVATNTNAHIDYVYYYESALSNANMTIAYQDGLPSPTPTISFNSPANNSIYFNNASVSLQVNTTTTNLGGSINQTHFIYDNSGNLVLNSTGTGANYSSNWSLNLSSGRYFINASFTNGSATNNTGKLNFTLYNFTVGAITNPTSNQNQTSEYLNITWTNTTISNNATNITNFIITLYDVYNNYVATIATSTILSYNWNVYQQNLSTGMYSIQVTVNDSFGKQANYTAVQFNLLTNALLNVTAYNISLSAAISTFNVSSIDLNNGAIGFYNTTTGLAYINMVKGNSYNITFTSTGYAQINQTYNANSSTYQSLQIISGPINSLTINVYDESTGLLVTQNTSLILTNLATSQQYNYTTINGTRLTSTLANGNYSLIVSSSSPTYYFPRYYYIQVENNYQIINTYIAATNNSVLFNTKTTAGTPISGILVRQYVNVNGSVVLAQSVLSDISGKAQFSYIPFTYYSFVASATGYNTNSFALNPVLFTSYDIVMDVITRGVVVPTAFVTFSPTSFYKSQTSNFNFTITSTYNGLTSYAYTFTGVGVNISHGGFNANGQSYSDTFSLANASSGQTMTLYYQYELANGVTYNRTIVYQINIPLYNQTLYSIGQDKTFGFEIGDRIFIVVVLDLICFGVGFLVFGPLGGLGLVLLNTGVFVSVGFVPAFMFYATIVIAVLYMFGQGANNG